MSTLQHTSRPISVIYGSHTVHVKVCISQGFTLCLDPHLDTHTHTQCRAAEDVGGDARVFLSPIVVTTQTHDTCAHHLFVIPKNVENLFR